MRPSRELLLVLALAVPAALCALPAPLGPLAGDPYPHLSGAGWVALGLLPLAVLLFANPGRPKGLLLGYLVALAGWAGVQLVARDLPDPFEARRATLVWLVAVLAFAGGSALGPGGRRRLSEALVLVSLLAVGGAFLGGDALAGPLGNSGATSQLALPGAALGGWFAVARRGAFGWLGGLAALAFCAHAVLAPVLAGVVAFVVGLASLLLSAELRASAGRVRTLGILLALPLLGLVLARALPAGETVEPDPVVAETQGSGDLAGVGVRARLWWSLVGAVGDRPLTGFGPGQFQALYPPHRDPREVELSRHGVCLGGLSEVEHAHDEPLHASAELGRPAGLLLLLFLGSLVALAVGRGVRGEREGTRGLGAASVAAVVAALPHASWSFVPASALVSFALFGALAGPSASPRVGRVLARAAAVGLALATLWALAFVRHGLALRDVTSAVAAGDARARHVALEDALAVAPTSFPARVALARTTSLPEDPAPWAALLEVRPHSVELLERLGHAHLRAGEHAAAADAWDRALALSPTHPRLLRNRVRLGWEHGDPVAADARFETLAAHGCVDDDWLRDRGHDCLLLGRVDAGLAVLARLDPDVNLFVPELLHERAREATEAGATRAGEALRAAAHTLFARDHAAGRDYRFAVVSYRQALAATAHAVEGGAVPLAVELTCAEWRADRADDALRRARELVVDERTRRDLPAWAREAWDELERALGT